MKRSGLGKIYRDGEIICREGEEGKTMYVIQSGRVEVVKDTDKGEVRLATLEEGDFFGEMALFTRLTRSATVKAVGEATVLSIDKKGFFTRAGEDPSFAFNLLDGMSRRIREMDDELSRLKKEKQ